MRALMWEKIIRPTSSSCAEQPQTGATLVVMADCTPDVATLTISRPTTKTMAIPLCTSLRGDAMVPGQLETNTRDGGKWNSSYQHRLQPKTAVILEYCAQNHVLPHRQDQPLFVTELPWSSWTSELQAKSSGAALFKPKLESSMNMNNRSCTFASIIYFDIKAHLS